MLEKLQIKVKKVHPEGLLPVQASEHAAGFDIHSLFNVNLIPNEPTLVNTGISLEVPVGYEAQVRIRSGLSSKKGIMLLNGVGTIDADYRGEIFVPLINTQDRSLYIRAGERIAQVIIAPIIPVTYVEVDTLTETKRGDGGFGSTGEK